ncbi:ATP-grasp domain-containing protein [Streptomyces sp. CT34]|uniref:ATP-grasp domain-containing protein n=1 Tax=Streptomyces sp. CT34 TaxID=1553907 RepID=UPI00068FA20D|nr:ATP-grasp domain-containing protein [Streptomyces sp. CT34]
MPWISLYDPQAVTAPASSGAEEVIAHTTVADTLDRLRPAGVTAVVPGSEAGVLLANEIAAGLGVAHNDVRSAAARRDKYLMARAVLDHGLPGAETALVHTREELADTLQQWTDAFPVVLKPGASSGSEGVKIVSTLDDALAAFESLNGTVNRLSVLNEGVVVQQYLDGTLYVVNTVSSNGAHVVTDVYEKRIDELNGSPVCRHLLLRRDLGDFEEAAGKYTMQCLDALGFRNGAAHTEVMRTEDGPRLVEVNSRLMGPSMPSDVFVPALGYSQATVLAERYTDEPGFFRRIDSRYAPRRFFAQAQLRVHQRGRVRALPGVSAIRRLPGFLAFRKLPVPGHVVTDPLLTTAENGICYFAHESEEVLRDSLDQLHVLEDEGKVFDVVAM